MAKAQCTTCLGVSSGETFEIAKTRIDHAVGLSTSRPCPGGLDNVIEIFDESAPKIKPAPKVISKPQKIIVEEKPKIIEPQKIKEEPKIIEPHPVKEKPKKQTRSVKIQSK